MATVCHPDTGRCHATFAGGREALRRVAVEPARRGAGNRKGVVEKANHTAAQRWWRTLPDEVSVEQAQARWTRWCASRGDTRIRADRRRRRSHRRRPWPRPSR